MFILVVFVFPFLFFADPEYFVPDFLLVHEKNICSSCFVTNMNHQVAHQLRALAVKNPEETVRLLVRVAEPCLPQLLSRLKPLLGDQVSSLGDGHHLFVVARVKEVMHEMAVPCVTSIHLDKMYGN